MATRSGTRRSNRIQSFSPSRKSEDGPLRDEDTIRLLQLENEMLQAMRKCHKSWETLERYHAFFLKELLNVKNSDVQHSDERRDMDILTPSSSTLITLCSDGDDACLTGMERVASRAGNKNSPSNVYVVTIDQKNDDPLVLSSTRRPRHASRCKNYYSNGSNRKRDVAKKKVTKAAVSVKSAAQKVQPCSVVLKKLSVSQVRQITRTPVGPSSKSSPMSVEILIQSGSVGEEQRQRLLGKRQHNDIVQETPRKARQQTLCHKADQLGPLSNKELFTTGGSDTNSPLPSSAGPPTKVIKCNECGFDELTRDSKSSSVDFVSSPSVVSTSSYTASEASDNALRKSARLIDANKRTRARRRIISPSSDTGAIESVSNRNNPVCRNLRKRSPIMLKDSSIDSSVEPLSPYATRKARSSCSDYQLSESTNSESSVTPPKVSSHRFDATGSVHSSKAITSSKACNPVCMPIRGGSPQAPPSPPHTRSSIHQSSHYTDNERSPQAPPSPPRTRSSMHQSSHHTDNERSPQAPPSPPRTRSTMHQSSHHTDNDRSPQAPPRTRSSMHQSSHHTDNERSPQAPASPPRTRSTMHQSSHHTDNERSPQAPPSPPRTRSSMHQSSHHTDNDRSPQAPASPPRTRSSMHQSSCDNLPSKGMSDQLLQSEDIGSIKCSSTPLSPPLAARVCRVVAATATASACTQSHNKGHTRSSKASSSNVTLYNSTLNNTSLLRKKTKLLLNSRPLVNDLSIDEDTAKNPIHTSVKVDARSFNAPKNKLSKRDKRQ